MTAVDGHRFRAVMAAVCAPVTIVTTTSAAGDPRGATVSSFTSLSLDPPLVSVAFDRRSALLAEIQAAGRFGVNLLGHGQDDLALRFATRGADRFGGDTAWFADDGLPRLRDAAGWVACDLERTVEAGDHLLIFGLVTALGRTELPPLVYAHRTFGTHSRFADRPRPPITDQIAACAR
ncbi:flavin reductase family protein [Amycolatopsis echigonensis]|uniref:Flavin reductase (DIM6/NTAB) family NADH-FMN oxidoreductase RutF n=1 Tax=Amycolatopsis echigonensis TaxID=2576905 RepID=A0A2N3WS36_9PSEU|nr:flavin reductase family protein [Amycolatopsis niigatensis]PKV96694.1 flavin reductase (DIM6/NTAB) family NADH-FMN oxidoreductase RutF [Amycolatopsis niigatensis]